MKKKAIYFLLSLLVSICLWIYVITVISPESTDTFHGITVYLENESVLNDRGLMVTSSKVPTVTLELSGNRSDLSKLNPANITLIADLSKIYTAGEQYVSYSIIFPGDVSPNTITVLNQSPSAIKLTISERETKDVPVVVNYNGKVPDGFMMDTENQELDHELVSVTGPAEVIDKIRQAVITVDLENQRETISQSYQYTLCDADGNAVDAGMVVTDVSEVKLTLKIQRVREIALELTVIPGGGATEQTAEITMSHTSIRVCGSEQLLEELGDTITVGELDLGQLTGDTEKKFSFKLPEGVTNLTMSANEVTVTAKFPSLKTKTLQVTRIQARNVPIGLKAEIWATELTVTVRGPQEEILALTEADITVSVDFSGAEAGTTKSFPAVVLVDAEESGAVGSYYVYAEVTEKSAAPAAQTD